MTHTLGGKPIIGKISHYAGPPKPQKSPEEFVAAVDAVIAIPGVQRSRWTQYTPYFNDGDACVFGANEYSLTLHFEGNGETDEISVGYPDGYFSTHYQSKWIKPDDPRADGKEPSRDEDANKVTYYWLDGSDDWVAPEGLDQAIANLMHALGNGEHDVLLLEVFGDPAEVTADADGYNVEDYDHE